MKVLYLHGMGSSGQTMTAQRLNRSLPGGYEVIAPDIPVQPELAITALKKIAETLSPDDVIVGTSMGGMYAQLFKGWRRYLINPSFHTSVHLKQNVGKRMPSTSLMLSNTGNAPAKLIKKFENMEAKQFDPKFGIFNGRKDSPELVTAFFGTRDTVVNCKQEYLKHFTKYHDFDGEHRVDPDTLINLVIPEIVNN